MAVGAAVARTGVILASCAARSRHSPDTTLLHRIARLSACQTSQRPWWEASGAAHTGPHSRSVAWTGQRIEAQPANASVLLVVLSAGLRERSRCRAMAREVDGEAADQKLGVLFVCLGNICRSPTAEGVFAHKVKQRGLDHCFHIDSAGTIDYHEGNPADSRSRAAAQKRGISITSRSRPIRPSDFEEFELILAMDRSNLADIKQAYHGWKSRCGLPPDGLEKVKLMCSYCTRFPHDEVPDPYYGGDKGFELVLDILDDACGNLLDSLTSKLAPKS